ncbi:MAG TPA: 5-formyltetrahydrofolate cyclo-ligase [Steroidobacteraceae bacterium]|nr:5-formyltetrahydrofolate cyclo-ligase [Steroidobacteraceae bacterium]
MNSGSHDRNALRRQLKTLRRAVPKADRHAAAQAVAHHVRQSFNLRPGLRIAVYASLPAELDTAPLQRLCRQHGCRLYLPRLTDLRRRRMQFVAACGAMHRNHLGIMEPVQLRRQSAHNLDLVFVPLVGFDAKGERLGMGAGYYDRAFAFLRRRRHWTHPRLIGLAYAFQQVAHIEGASHDVRLNAVITEKGLIKCNTGY